MQMPEVQKILQNPIVTRILPKPKDCIVCQQKIVGEAYAREMNAGNFLHFCSIDCGHEHEHTALERLGFYPEDAEAMEVLGFSGFPKDTRTMEIPWWNEHTFMNGGPPVTGEENGSVELDPLDSLILNDFLQNPQLLEFADEEEEQEPNVGQDW